MSKDLYVVAEQRDGEIAKVHSGAFRRSNKSSQQISVKK